MVGPLVWVMLALLALAGAGVAWEARTRANRALDASVPKLRAAAKQVHRRLAELQERREYLTRPVQTELQAALSQAVPPQRYVFLAAKRSRDALEQAKMELKEAAEKIEAYNAAHVQRELEAHGKLLFQDEGLNAEQAAAAVRDDVRNLVVAAAGSGKTRVLRARIRYLLARHAAVSPGRVVALSYTDDAAKEVRGRLETVGIRLRASTLHSLGYEIVGRTRGRKPKVVGKDLLGDMIRSMLHEANQEKDPRFTGLVREALAVFHRDEIELPEDPGLKRRTLAGETVKSLGERRIADFLFLHGVDYAYENPARWAPQDAAHREYLPDFTLPKHALTIEHWGTKKDGTVPAHFSQTTQEYKARMEWVRKIHRKTGRILVEMYDHERQADFEGLLAKRLRERNVQLHSLSLAELKARVPNLTKVQEAFAKTLGDFVSNARSLRIKHDEIEARARSFSPRVQAFARCGSEVLRRYEEHLRESEQVDFTDMIHEAAEILERGEASDEYRFDHVLIDEFQDLSGDRARLIQALLAFGGGKLFAVGDDWQAIFAFSGGNVGYIVDFEKHFGPCTLSTLGTNHRSPEAIVEAGTVLIEQNPRQIRKEVRARRPTKVPPMVHTVPDDPDAVWERVAALAKKELEALKSEASSHEPQVMIITRVGKYVQEHIRAHLRAAKVPAPDGKILGLTTAHKAKGTEAPVVIIADATEDIFGFPCQVEGTDLLLPVRMSVENPEEEERRLFYVALTRATERLHIVTREGRPSRFLLEIQGEALAPPSKVDELTHGQRVTLVGTVVQFLPPSEDQRNAGMAQLGLLQIGRERILFKSWRSSSPPILEQGCTYELATVKIEVYNGRRAAVLDERTHAQARTTMTATSRELEGAVPLKIRPRSRR